MIFFSFVASSRLLSSLQRQILLDVLTLSFDFSISSLSNSKAPRYALDAWARFELLGAPRGPCGDRTSAEDLHLNFTDTWTTLYLLKFLNKQQHTDTGHQLQNNFSQHCNHWLWALAGGVGCFPIISISYIFHLSLFQFSYHFIFCSIKNTTEEA